MVQITEEGELEDRMRDLQLESLEVGDGEGEEGSGSDGGDDGEEDEDLDDEDEDEEEEDGLPRVMVGYAQKPQKAWALARHHFPSKAGGTPAWLDPVRLPDGKDSSCGFCNNPLEFLLQVYAPIDDVDEAFHRTLFVFMCPSMICLQKDQTEQKSHAAHQGPRSVKVFRSQLPRENPYYSTSPPRSDGQDAPSCEGAVLCSWCGTWKAAKKVCGGCKQTRYCSKSHQLLHWRAGHSSFCREVQAAKASNTADNSDNQNKIDVDKTPGASGKGSGEMNQGGHEYTDGIALAANTKSWPEFELVVDDEPTEQVLGQGDYSARSRERSLYIDYMRRMAESPADTDVRGVEQASKEQQHWASFQARLARAPEQILRYCRSEGTKPLWPRLDQQPADSDIPPCGSCGGPRIFEFQILPQLLYFLQVENEAKSLDWATIAVYTCASSCHIGAAPAVSQGYKEEYAWVQLESYGA